MDSLNALAEMKLILYQYNLLHQKLAVIPENQNDYDELKSRRQDLCDRFKALRKRQPKSALTESFRTLDESWKKKTFLFEDSGYFLPDAANGDE